MGKHLGGATTRRVLGFGLAWAASAYGAADGGLGATQEEASRQISSKITAALGVVMTGNSNFSAATETLIKTKDEEKIQRMTEKFMGFFTREPDAAGPKGDPELKQLLQTFPEQAVARALGDDAADYSQAQLRVIAETLDKNLKRTGDEGDSSSQEPPRRTPASENGIVVSPQDFSRAYEEARSPSPQAHRTGPTTGFAGTKAPGGASAPPLVVPSQLTNYDVARDALEAEARAGRIPRESVPDLLRRIGPVLDRIDDVGSDVDKIRAVLGVNGTAQQLSDGDLKVVLKVSNVAASAPSTTNAAIASPASSSGAPTPAAFAGTTVLAAAAPLSVPASQALQEFEGLLKGAPTPEAKRGAKISNAGVGEPTGANGPSLAGGAASDEDTGSSAQSGLLASNTPAGAPKSSSAVARFIRQVVSIFRGESQEKSATSSSKVPSGGRVIAGSSAMKTPRLGSESDLKLFSAAFLPKQAAAGDTSVDWMGWLFGAALLGLLGRFGWLWRTRAKLKA